MSFKKFVGIRQGQSLSKLLDFAETIRKKEKYENQYNTHHLLGYCSSSDA